MLGIMLAGGSTCWRINMLKDQHAGGDHAAGSTCWGIMLRDHHWMLGIMLGSSLDANAGIVTLM